jgi:hypothetical protein
MKQESPFRVYRLDPATGEMTIAVGDMRRPNGLAFSPDEKLLYVVDTPGPGQRTVQVYDVVDNGTRTTDRREFCSAEPGGSDGLRVDVDGNATACSWPPGNRSIPSLSRRKGCWAGDRPPPFLPDQRSVNTFSANAQCRPRKFGKRFVEAFPPSFAFECPLDGLVQRLSGSREIGCLLGPGNNSRSP